MSYFIILKGFQGKLIVTITLAFLTMILILGGLFIYGNKLANKLSENITISAEASQQFKNFWSDIETFIQNQSAILEINSSAEILKKNTFLSSYQENFNKLIQLCYEIDSLRKENMKIREDVIKSAYDNILQSDTYIEGVVKRLTDTAEAEKVTTLEKLVILGALTNTTTNYKMLNIFERLSYDPNAKDEIYNFFKVLFENVERDIERLKDTDFAQLPVNAKNAGLLMYDLTVK